MNSLNLSSSRTSSPASGTAQFTLPDVLRTESSRSTTTYAENQPPAPAQLQALAGTHAEHLSRLPTKLNTEVVEYLLSDEINNLIRTSRVNYQLVQTAMKFWLIVEIQHTTTPLLRYGTPSLRKDRYLAHDLPGLVFLNSMGIDQIHSTRQIKNKQCTVKEVLQTSSRNEAELARLLKENLKFRQFFKNSSCRDAIADLIKCGLLTVPEILRLNSQGKKALHYDGVHECLQLGLMKSSDLNRLNNWSCLFLDYPFIQSGIERGVISIDDVIKAENIRLDLDSWDSYGFGVEKYFDQNKLTLAQFTGLSMADCLDLNLKVVQQYLDTGKMTMAEMLTLNSAERRTLPPLVDRALNVDR